MPTGWNILRELKDESHYNRKPSTGRALSPAGKMPSRKTATDVSPDSVAVRNEAMIFADLDDIVVMMDADRGLYYELDPVGARIWSLLETARPVAQLCGVLVEEYDVTPDTCHRDVLDFLARAAELGIVEVRGPAAP